MLNAQHQLRIFLKSSTKCLQSKRMVQAGLCYCLLISSVAGEDLKKTVTNNTAQKSSLVFTNQADAWIFTEGITSNKINLWIGELADADYRVRENAETKLRQSGKKALPTLKHVLHSTDPESRERARRLVSLIEKEIETLQLKRFVEDPNGDLKIQLPGWKEFQNLPPALTPSETRPLEKNNQHSLEKPKLRALAQKNDRIYFAKIYLQNQSLFKQLFPDSEISSSKALELMESILLKMAQQKRLLIRHRISSKQQVSTAVVILLRAASLTQKEISPQHFNSLAQYSRTLTQSISIGQESKHQTEILRKLLNQFLTKCPLSDLNSLYYAQMIGIQLQLPYTAKLAAELLEHKNCSSHYRIQAILTIGLLKEKQYIDTIEKFLKSEVPVYRMSSIQRKRLNLLPIEMRDVALAVLIHLTDQDLLDYGYKNVQPVSSPQILFRVNSLRFESKEQRKKALKKWEEWRNKNLKKDTSS